MGTSTSEKGKRLERRDHPHAYGDKAYQGFFAVTGYGSSPRVWGQAGHETTFETVARIIPTRMGTSANNVILTLVARDHPHAYGDKNLIMAFLL